MILQKRSAESERNISMNNSLNYVSGFELEKITTEANLLLWQELEVLEVYFQTKDYNSTKCTIT